jgi:hypothetical protein
MVFDVLIVASVVGATCWWQQRPQQARHARDAAAEVSLLAYDDLPPIGAFDPLPDHRGLDDYVERGLERLSVYLEGHDRTA